MTETAPQELLDAIHADRVQPLASMPHLKSGQASNTCKCGNLLPTIPGSEYKCHKCGIEHKVPLLAQSLSEPATRYDEGKTPFADFDTYFDPGFAAEIGRAFEYGARKYGKDNWQKGMSWSRCLNSARRHILHFWRGEKNDRESGIHHLAHAICSLMFLFVYERGNIGKDDR